MKDWQRWVGAGWGRSRAELWVLLCVGRAGQNSFWSKAQWAAEPWAGLQVAAVQAAKGHVLVPKCANCAAAVLQVLCMTFGQQQMVMTRLYSYIVAATPQVCGSRGGDEHMRRTAPTPARLPDRQD
jgi:hypothetical protein